MKDVVLTIPSDEYILADHASIRKGVLAFDRTGKFLGLVVEGYDDIGIVGTSGGYMFRSKSISELLRSSAGLTFKQL